MSSNRSIIQIDPKDLHIVNIFSSIKSSAEYSSVSVDNFRRSLLKNKKTNGYIWKYLDIFVKNGYVRGFVDYDNIFKFDILNALYIGSLSDYKFLRYN